MSTLQIKVCDNCGYRDDKEVGNVKNIYVNTGYQTCPATARSELTGESVDLCPRCLVYLVGELFRKIDDISYNDKLIKGLKKK